MGHITIFEARPLTGLQREPLYFHIVKGTLKHWLSGSLAFYSQIVGDFCIALPQMSVVENPLLFVNWNAIVADSREQVQESTVTQME